MSLYGKYILERQNKQIVESDIGFATYFFINEGVYIENIYVEPEHRQSGEAAKMADQIAKIAKEKGLNKMYGTVQPSSNGSTTSLKTLLAYGFLLDTAASDVIFLKKDI